ncbi:NAD/NADP-dependent octopine/nopaline dehydrogenase family protein [Anaerolentibacter hominis]|uniref:NAD/NADP-dependent octopine/nopaline dehydrogenase family protein n=1 Tax=Anaerolentibacter hominis TaxID=3079009 RepID=UPI0031B80768
MINNQKVAIISTGNGGQSMAAYFAYKGYDTALYAREQERVDMFPSWDFTISGEINANVHVNLISSSMKDVVENAHLIMVTTPSQYHSTVAREMAPFLERGQIIVLNPGRTFGTYEFDRVLQEQKVSDGIIIAEAETFIFTCRCLEVGCPAIYKIKHHVGIAAHRDEDTEHVVNVMSRAFPSLYAAKSVLHTGFGNIGMIFHPVPILMNITRVEAKEHFKYYHNAISPFVAQVLERLDKERRSIADAVIGESFSVNEWLKDKYDAEGDTLYECLQNAKAYSEVYAPSDIYSRYVFEDIPTGFVPMYCMGRHLGIEMPVTEAVIKWASVLYDYDFMGRGRNEKKLNLDEIIEQGKKYKK